MIHQVHLVEDHLKGRENNNIQAHQVDNKRSRLKMQQMFNLTVFRARKRIGEAPIARAHFIHNHVKRVIRNFHKIKSKISIRIWTIWGRTLSRIRLNVGQVRVMPRTKYLGRLTSNLGRLVLKPYRRQVIKRKSASTRLQRCSRPRSH